MKIIIVVIFGVLTGVAGVSYMWHKSEVKAAVEAARASAEAEHRVALDEQRKRLVARSDEAKGQIEEQLALNARKKDEQIKKLNSDINNLRNSLQQRPERPNSYGDLPRSTTPAETAKGCTGAELYKNDGNFLIGEASRADTVRSELQACYRQYDIVREALNKFLANNK